MARLKKYELRHGEGSFFQRADGMWVGTAEAGWTERGTRRRITVRSIDKDEAWDKLSARRKTLALEGVAAAMQRSITLAAWLDRWLEQTGAALSPKAQNGARSYCKRWIVPILGQRKLEEVTAADVRRLGDAVVAAGRSTTTAEHVQAKLQLALKAAIAEGYAVPEAALLAKRRRPAKSNRAALPLVDALKMIEHARTLPDAARWVAALLQGMRQGECLGLLWEHVDFRRKTLAIHWQLQPLPYEDRAAGTFRVPDGYEHVHLWRSYHLVPPKWGRRRVVPLVPWMHDALKAWAEVTPPSPLGLVWPRVGEPDKPREARRDDEAWYVLQDAAGVAKVPGVHAADDEGWEVPPVHYGIHEARHTTATLLMGAGISDEVIRQIMGHSDVMTTQGYQHVDQSLMLAALNRSAGALGLTPPLMD